MTRRTVAFAFLCLLAAPAHAEWIDGARPDIPLLGDGTTWLVRATINGRANGLFLLDTGASLCVLTPATAKRLALEETGQTAQLQTANGAVRAPVVRLGEVDVGGTRIGGVDAIVHGGIPDTIDGVIGLSFLNRFSYTIDPRRRVLRLR
ncbi:MAG: retropepsin-like aspartic protease [Candidatus Binatia bacterium]